jgi:hypothetical protein
MRSAHAGFRDCLSEASPNAAKREARNEPERSKRGTTVGTRLWGHGDDAVDNYGLSTDPPLQI